MDSFTARATGGRAWPSRPAGARHRRLAKGGFQTAVFQHAWAYKRDYSGGFGKRRFLIAIISTGEELEKGPSGTQRRGNELSLLTTMRYHVSPPTDPGTSFCTLAHKSSIESSAFLNFSTPGTPAFNHWCNFCISPAFYACGAPQQYDKFGRPAPSGARRENGCGLLLCLACADALGQSGMDRMKLEEQVRVRGNWRIRADMEFLFHGSDLHKAYYLA